jgi:methyltransferase (TIGR00027 family)
MRVHRIVTAVVALLAPAAALEPDQPSRVALLMAAARAHTSHEPDPTVRNPDWLADPLLSPDEIALLMNHPIARAVNQDYRIATLDPEVSGFSRAVLVRTRFMDERFDRALRDGITQFVILGAGFDTRAYRFRSRLQGRTIIEVDQAATQELKKRRMQEVLGAPPAGLTYAPFDPQRDRFENVLRRAVFDLASRTLFLWESGSMYYPEAVVREVLRAVARCPPGSSLVMDYAPKSLLEKVTRDPASPQNHWDAAWGEPWVFSLPDGDPRAVLGTLTGLQVSATLETNSSLATERYLTRRDRSIFGPPPGAPGSGFEPFFALVLVDLLVPQPRPIQLSR